MFAYTMNDGFDKLFESYGIKSEQRSIANNLLEGIRKQINKLHEAQMSPEDKEDSDNLRRIYNFIDGNNSNVKKLSQADKDLLAKYNLDAWGFKGDTSLATPGNNLVTDFPKDKWRSNRSNLVNMADRARKIDTRAEQSRDIKNSGSWSNTFQDKNREYDNRNLSMKTNQMKSALRDRKWASDKLNGEIDNQYDAYEDQTTDQYNKDVANVISNSERAVIQGQKEVDAANKNIDDILKKYKHECLESIKSLIEKLNEDVMSDADKEETARLYDLYNKVKNDRYLTKNDKELMAKYNLKAGYNDLYTSDNKPLIGRGDVAYDLKYGDNKNKINLADMARKRNARDYNVEYSTLDKERDNINKEMSQDVNDMKRNLETRKYYQNRVDRKAFSWDKTFDDTMSELSKEYNNKMNDLKSRRELAKMDAQKKFNDANTKVKAILGKDESLNESESDKRIIETGLTGVKNKEILDSIMGQLSDGMWENSPAMQKYWKFADINGTNIEVSNRRYIYDNYTKKTSENPYYDMSDTDIKKFFANKLKAIAQQYLHDNNMNPYKNWNEDCDEVCDYLDRFNGNDVTVGDAYKAYKALK